MTAIILESLVLRGVVVLRDEQTLELRLGTSGKGGLWSSGANPNPPAAKPEQDGRTLDPDYSASRVGLGAGRFHRCSGFLAEQNAMATTLRPQALATAARTVAANSWLAPTVAVAARVGCSPRLLPPGRTPPALPRGEA